jgi:hypothetical protein
MKAARLLAFLLLLPAGLRARILVIDTFDGGTPGNKLKGATTIWGDESDKSIGCAMAFDPNVRRGDEGYGLRLDYDIESDRENVVIPPDYSISVPARRRDDFYNGYNSVLAGADATPFKYFILWARSGESSSLTRSFKVEIKDPTSVAGVMVDGLSDKWQKFVIPLGRFKELKDLSKLREWTIVFGPDTVSRKTGTIYIDDVYFATDPDEKIRNPALSAVASRLAAPPVMDGRLGDWDPSRFTDFSDPAVHHEMGKILGEKDLKASFAAGWDYDFLYIAVDVRDNQIVSGQSGADIWKDDCIEIYIDPRRDGFLWNSPRDFQLGFAPAAAADKDAAAYAWFQKKVPSADEIRWRTTSRKEGYQLEAAVSWAFLGLDPRQVEKLGFSVAVHDRDSRKEGKLNWSYFSYEGKGSVLGTLSFQ